MPDVLLPSEVSSAQMRDSLQIRPVLPVKKSNVNEINNYRNRMSKLIADVCKPIISLVNV